MYGRAYWIFLSRGRSTPAMRAMCYPCRCLCLGLRLQITRTTPRRRITLQCSQIGRTLERTFTGPSPQQSQSAGSVLNYRRARKFPQGARLGRRPYLRQPPPVPRAAKPQQHRFAPLVRRARHHVAAIQLYETPSRLDFAQARHSQGALARRAQVAPQQLDRLRPPERRRRIGAGDLEHDASTLSHKRLGIVGEPGDARRLGRLGKRALAGERRRGERQAHDTQRAPHRHSTSRWYTPPGAAARVMGRPTMRWVAPPRTASWSAMVRAWS